tara:strand:+ start:58042 stop:58836 length:795 start_codon:yes stop_codon:yes gene_type:complete
MEFVRNNIRYRSAASKALEGYYNSKAFILNELVLPANGFSETAKEIILLMFNKHADWLSFAEPLLLNKSEVSGDDLDQMLSFLDSVSLDINEILEEHTDVFDPGFVRHWNHIHRQAALSVQEALRSVEGMSQIIAFPYATECLVEYLNSSLFEMYELDTLLGSDIAREQMSTNRAQPEKMTLYMDDTTIRYGQSCDAHPEIERLEYYVDNILDRRKRFQIVVRDYTSKASIEDARDESFEELSVYLAGLQCVESVEKIRPHSTS